MNGAAGLADVAGLVGLLNEELDLELTPAQADLPLDALPGWDSMLLLRVLLALEAAAGRPQSLADLLTAGTLRELHQVVRR
jgi:acyl carrier protein